MALQAFPVKRVQDPAPVRNLIEITPKNWRRYPGKVITEAMVLPIYVATVGFNGGTANQGAASGQNGETGTANVTNDWGPKTQAERAAGANLTPGTTIAPDVGKSYHGTRGTVEPFKKYPDTTKPPTTVTPPAFLPSQQL